MRIKEQETHLTLQEHDDDDDDDENVFFYYYSMDANFRGVPKEWKLPGLRPPPNRNYKA